MELHMTFKHMDSTEAIKAHVQAQTHKLEKFVNGPFKADWVFLIEGNEQVADLRVHGPHVDLYAQAKTSDLYQSIDQAIDKLEAQLRKNKEILKDHLHRK